MALTFVIHGRSTSNNRTTRANTDGVRPIKTQAVRDERARIGWIVRAAMSEQSFARVKWFRSTIVTFNTRKDLDNIPKIVLDGIKKLAVEDDRYHLESHQKLQWDDGGERIEVTLEEVDPTAYGRKPDRARQRTTDATEQRHRRAARSRAPHLPPMVARLLDKRREMPKMPRQAPPDDA